MGIDRRTFLVAGTAAFCAGAGNAQASTRRGAYLTCAHTQGGYAALGLASDANIAFSLDLPARGHGWAISPDGTDSVVFARRPGTFAAVLDPRSGAQKHKLKARPGRHYCGHGFFSADGSLLLATENDFEGERGILGLYNPGADYMRIGEWDAHGLDTHEAILILGGRLIAAANGGILTHPDFPREILNIADMDPSLAFLDARTGKLVWRARPPHELQQLSIRHLAEDALGMVWLGCQYEGPAGDDVPLIGRAAPGQEIEWLDLGRETTRRLRQYVGSVAANAAGDKIAVASPRGGVELVFDAASAHLTALYERPDVCGLAPFGPQHLATDGKGHVWRGPEQLAIHPSLAFDNHIGFAGQGGWSG